MYTGQGRQQGGFGLVEVLVAALVLAIGLLGIAGLISAGLKSTDSANLRTQANVAAQDILERMRANRERALAGDYDIDALSAEPQGAGVVLQDVTAWKQLLRRQLPSPDASSIGCDSATGICRVVISLDDTRGEIGTRRLTTADDGTLKRVLELVYATRL